ncbi:hypothetical protein D3C75_903690 [compost metagenome]
MRLFRPGAAVRQITRVRSVTDTLAVWDQTITLVCPFSIRRPLAKSSHVKATVMMIKRRSARRLSSRSSSLAPIGWVMTQAPAGVKLRTASRRPGIKARSRVNFRTCFGSVR